MTTNAATTDAVLPEIETPDRAKWLVPAAVVTVLVLWASSFIAVRALAGSLSPGPLGLGRLAVGSVALGAIALRYRRPLPRGRALGLVAAYGVLWFAAYTVILNAAGHHLDAGTSAMLVNIAPILVAIGAGLFLGEGFPRTLIVGIAISFSGVALIATGSASGSIPLIGLVLGASAAVLYAAGVMTQKVALRSVDAVTATWLGCTIGLVTLLPFLPQAIDEFSTASTGTITAVIYLGIFPTAIAFTMWAYALTNMNAGRLTSTTLAVPAIAVAMSWLLLGETPALIAIIGGTLCLTGVAISRRPSATRHAPRSASN